MNILRLTRFIQAATFNAGDTYRIESETVGLKLSTPNVILRLNDIQTRVDATRLNITEAGTSTSNAGLRIVELSIFRSSTSPLVYNVALGTTSLLRLNDNTPYIRVDARLRVIAPDTMSDVITIERTFTDSVLTSPEMRFVGSWTGTGNPPQSLAIGGVRWRLLSRDGARIYAHPIDYSDTKRETEMRIQVSDATALRDMLRVRGNALGFFGTAPATKQAVTGRLSGTAALSSLLSAMHTYGLITNSADTSVLSVTGSRGGNAALASLLTRLDELNIINDNTTA